MRSDVAGRPLHPLEARAATNVRSPGQPASVLRKNVMRPPVFTAVLACLALAACATARKADVRLPVAYEAPAGAPAGAVPLDKWWLAFNDAELTQLIDQALARNPDARTAAARLSEARANNIEAFTHYLPQGDVTGSSRRTDTHQLAGTVVNFPGFST